MADFDTQINVGMNVDGVITGTEKAKRSVRDLGESAREAGRGTGAIGDGMAQSATKVEQATKSMVGSLQRQIAATEAGDKSTRAYQESLARMRGVDLAVLKPYLDQLDAAKEKAGQAAKANADLGSSFGDLGSRSVFAANAVAMVGAAVGAAFSAASIKAVIDVADTFSKLAQKSGVAVESLRELNYAASLSDVSTEAFGNSLRKLSQNMSSAAGGGKQQIAAFDAIGISIKGVDGALKGADQVLKEVAGKFANFSDGPEKAALAMELFGKQGADLIPLLNSGASGLSEMAAEAQGLGIVFGSDLAKNSEAFNDNLTRLQTGVEGAKIAIANELLPTLNLLAQTFVDAQKSGSGFASFIGGALRTVMEAAVILYSDVAFVLKGIGREIGAVAAQYVAFMKLDFKGFSAISEAVKEDGVRARAELDKFQYDLLNAGILTSKAGAGRGTAPDPRSLGSTETTAPIVASTEALKQNKEALKAQAAALKEQAERMKISREIAMQMGDAVTKANDAYQKSLVDATKDNQKFIDGLNKSADAVAAQVLKLQDEEKALGIAAEQNITLAQAIEQVEIARLREAQAIQLSYGDNTAAEAIQREIEQRKLLATAIDSKDVREASAKTAKTAADDWKKAAEKINDSITDALLRGFESGKGFAENLRDVVVNMFKTMVLRPTVSAIVTGLSGGAFGGAANAATTATGLSDAGGLIGGVGQMAAIGTAFGEGFVSTLAGNSLTVAAQAAGGGTLAGIGGAVGAVAPYVLAAAAVYALLTQDKNYVKSTGDAAVNFGSTGGVASASDFKGQSYEANLSTAANKFVVDLNAEYLKAAKTLDLGAVSSAFAFGSNDAGKFRIGGAAGNSTFDSGELDQTPEAIKLAAARAVFAAIQGSELPKYLAGVFDNISASTATQEQIDASIAAAQALKGFYDQVQASPFENVKNLSFAATKGLIEFSGGLDKLSANLGTYYNEFFSAEEKRGQTLQNIAKTINEARTEVGPTVPLTPEQIGNTSRAQFRAVIDGLDVTTTAGQKLYAAMLSVSGAFAGITDSADAIAKASEKTAKDAADAAEKIADQRFGLESQLLTLQGNTVALRQREIAALDPSNRALQEQIYALEDMADAAKAAEKAQDDYVSAVTKAGNDFASAQSAVKSALNAVESVQGQGTSAYLSAQEKVAAAQEKVANIAQQSAQKTVDAAIKAAERMRDLSESLRDFALDKTNPTERFGKLLTRALAGDAEAMQGLTGAATSAIDSSRDSAGSGAAARIAEAKIVAGVYAASLVAQANSALPGSTEVDPLIAANAELSAAQTNLAEALRVANAINAPLTTSISSLIGKYAEAQNALLKAQTDLAVTQATFAAIATSTAATVVKLGLMDTNLASVFTSEFMRLDTSLDGVLSSEEFIKGMAGKATDAELQAIYTKADANNDGVVTLLEAISAYNATTASNTSVRELLVPQFEQLDASVNGLLSFDQFKTALVGLANDATLVSLYNIIDANGDDVVSKLEALDTNLSVAFVTEFSKFDTSLDGLLTADEFLRGMAGKATDAELKAIYTSADTNNDGVVTLLEAIKVSSGTTATNTGVSELLAPKFAELNSSVQSLLSFDQFKTAFVGLANDATLKSLYTIIDTNGDTVVSKLEALDANISATLVAQFSALDTSFDGVLTSAEFIKGMAGKATDAELKAIYTKADTNSNGVVTLLEAIKASNAAISTASATTATNSASFATAATSTVSFAANDPIRSVFSNISQTNALLLDGLQLQLTQLLGVGINEDLTPVGARDTAFAGTYKIALDSRNYLATIASNTGLLAHLPGINDLAAHLPGINTNTANTAGSTAYGAGLAASLLAQIQSGSTQIKFDRYGYTSGVYAQGGAFTNGIVQRPTYFDQGLMGEAGPEAIMPLSKTSDGSLGIQVQMPDWAKYGRGEGSAELVSEIRSLRSDNAAQARAMVQLQQRLTKLMERWDGTGMPETRVTA